MNTEGTMNIGETVSMPTTAPQTSTNWNTALIVGVIIILAILGLNVFVYLAKGTDLVTFILEKAGGLIKQVLQLFGGGMGRTLDLTKTGLSKITKTDPDASKWKAQDLDKTLDKKKPEIGNTNSNVVGDSTDAKKIQSGNKKGWCYIGKDRDFRSCLHVTEDDKCLSNKIFPTKQQCEHPELRYD